MARKTHEGDSDAAPRLTERQRRIVDIIQQSLAERSYPPSMREIGDACGLASLSSVTHQLARLQEMGYLRGPASRAPWRSSGTRSAGR